MDTVRSQGGEAILYNAFSAGSTAVLYSRDEARSTMERSALAILAGGTGNPFFSTDSAAALRAAELGCSVFYKGTKVDGVYDKDPEKYDDAKQIPHLTIDEMLERRLGVIDLTAATLCRENSIDVRVYRMTDSNVIFRAAMGEPLGSLVSCSTSG